ncbi:hypothetical protein [Neisseria chenwenguii]|uniref:Uncharacterized protein n=1 Tax=Neisseria chenwenguii TaxID=1853278 RepID=A0A220S124_9NEIS|nr:hypothetical protein [Neisseria chenwenguii]ASK27181.1 hypothetical protein BG910_04985 [Neisseria chenwenguii]ROV54883.1 hypothetical protein EGS38_10375 [Neisseria chenwenguii]
MLPNKVLGKYDLKFSGRDGLGAAWVMAAVLLPVLVWTVFILARMLGWLPATKANPAWALAWLGLCLPCLLIAAKCFGWKGWGAVGNILFFMVICAVIHVPAGLLVAFTLADWLKAV